MLVFTDDEVEVNKGASTETCDVCERRRAMWLAVVQTPPTDEGLSVCKVDGKVTMCGWCILYSSYCQWGYENHEEILHVGRAAQEHAAKCNKPVPALDERGRLVPEDAERFLLGVAFTNQALKKMFSVAKLSGEV